MYQVPSVAITSQSQVITAAAVWASDCPLLLFSKARKEQVWLFHETPAARPGSSTPPQQGCQTHTGGRRTYVTSESGQTVATSGSAETRPPPLPPSPPWPPWTCASTSVTRQQRSWYRNWCWRLSWNTVPVPDPEPQWKLWRGWWDAWRWITKAPAGHLRCVQSNYMPLKALYKSNPWLLIHYR